MLIWLHFFLLCYILGAIVPVYTRNITVDDQGIDPTTGTYITYEAEWAVGPDCSSCGSQPDPTFAYDGTWHDTSYSIINPHDFVRNATFRFTGTAIYVYGMVNSAFGIDLVFFLDGQDAGRFSMPPTGEFNYSYNQLYFQAEGLNHTTHTWILQNGRGENVTSNVLLDYLVYMKDDAAGNSSLPLFGESVPSSGTAAQSTSSDSSTNTSTSLRATVTVETRANGLPPSVRTAVIVIATVIPVVLVIVLVLVCRVRRRRSCVQARSIRPTSLDSLHGLAIVSDSRRDRLQNTSSRQPYSNADTVATSQAESIRASVVFSVVSGHGQQTGGTGRRARMGAFVAAPLESRSSIRGATAPPTYYTVENAP